MPTALARSARPRRARATARVRELAAETGLAGIVLTAPGPVAWASGGVNVPVDRGAAVDTVWLAVGRDRTTLVTANVEERRLVDEFGDTDVDVRAVPWWDGDAMVTAAAEALGAAPDRIGADGHPGFGHDLSDALTARRLALGADEQDELRRLGVDAATALQSALRAWRPGDTDHAVAARVVAALESNGADAPVLIVGGDERVLRYRHPLAVGAPMDHLAMGVVVARRGGLHVATTRYATYGPADPGLMASLDAARAIHLDVLRAGTPAPATTGPGGSTTRADRSGSPNASSRSRPRRPRARGGRQPWQTGARWHGTPAPRAAARTRTRSWLPLPVRSWSRTPRTPARGRAVTSTASGGRNRSSGRRERNPDAS